jgi:ribosome biogenesis GTPase
MITSFSPRLNVLSRPYSAHDSRKKIILKPIASNIQQLFIVVATRPIVPIATIDRYIVMARLLGIPKIYLVINKFDYLEESEAFYQSIRFYEDSLQIPMIKTSIKNHLGLDKISSLLINRSSIFVGQSGVGKSSLINLLLPHLAIKANPLVKNDQYGAHTTSNAKLYHFYSKDTNASIDSKEDEVSDGSRILPCPEGLHHGVILDSPGVRELGTWHLSSDQITEGFEEIAEHAKHCRYRNCDHLPEEGGDNNKKQCAVIEGVYEKRIHPSRYRSYLTLLQQLMQ